MEDILILIIQGIVEFLFELFGYLPWDLWWDTRPFDAKDEDNSSYEWILLWSAVVGGFLGYFSTFIFPNVIIKFGWLRIALLFISPLVSGFVASLMAQNRQKKGLASDPTSHFWLSFCFSMGLVWIRFAFAHRV